MFSLQLMRRFISGWGAVLVSSWGLLYRQDDRGIGREPDAFPSHLSAQGAGKANRFWVREKNPLLDEALEKWKSLV